MLYNRCHDHEWKKPLTLIMQHTRQTNKTCIRNPTDSMQETQHKLPFHGLISMYMGSRLLSLSPHPHKSTRLSPRDTARPCDRRLRARDRSGCSARDITPVVRHVRLYKMTCTQRAIKGQFAGQHAGGDNAGEKARVVAWCGGMGTTDP
jgi:hypothetical protein